VKVIKTVSKQTVADNRRFLWLYFSRQTVCR